MSYPKEEIGCYVTLRQGFAINKKTNHHMSDEITPLHLLRIGDMKENSFCMYVKDTIPENFIAHEDDIIYTRTGQVGLVFRNQHGVVHNNCFTVTPIDENMLCREYLYYALQSQEFYMEANSRASGVAQPDLPHSAFESIKIYLPELRQQKKIGQILSKYDELILSNQKQIKLLEEAAQRLYKEWFVDLRFPNYKQSNIVDGIPEGWKKVTLDDICVLRKETLKPEKIEEGIPYIGLEHMPRNDICLAEWGDSNGINSNKLRCYENDVIFGKIRPYFHKVGYVLVNCISSTDAIVMVAKEGLWGLLLMITSSVSFVDYTYKTCKEGAKMPRADWNEMKKYPTLVATEDIQKNFEKSIWIITRKIRFLAIQNRKLIEARDRLLPKLMNGEIEV